MRPSRPPAKCLFAILAASATCVPAAEQSDVARLSASIDQHITARLHDENVEPAPLADDAEFLRRVYLDIAGKIPPVSVVREFLARESSDKRREIVDDLLNSSAYVTNFTNVWRQVLMPEANADVEVRFLLPSFEAWLRQHLIANTPYDAIVREILTLPLEGRSINRNEVRQQVSPLAFYQAKQIAPADLAAATSRMFLGIRLECAQCHDHPFDAWKQVGFWRFAAFYAGIEREGDEGVFSPVRELFDRREILIADTRTVVQAAYLGNIEPRWETQQSARQNLAHWVTANDNPYFSQTLANRIWGHFFGIGIVNPVDDFGEANPPSHPQLLNVLASELVRRQFDLKFLMRAITASTTYQRSSVQLSPVPADPQLFARVPVKGFTPQQLVASLSEATGFFQPFALAPRNINQPNTPFREFLDTFDNSSDARTETQSTILQALAMMNGGFVTQATRLESSRILSVAANYPDMSAQERIEMLFMATLSRKPTRDEIIPMARYVDQGGTENDANKALADIFWVLLNTGEFMLNH